MKKKLNFHAIIIAIIMTCPKSEQIREILGLVSE